ncbi:MAG: LuxR family transcriptional regulator [Burkholderiales bacterium]|nr:LuxR family transcriptional regulator [Burkholderiales bacterium]
MVPPHLAVPLHATAVPIRLASSDATHSEDAPAHLIRRWARDLGFDGVTTFALPQAGSIATVEPVLWSTWNDAWLARYAAERWFDVDPRLAPTLVHGLPCLWDGGSIAADRRPQSFFDAAAREGIRSGLAIPMSSPRGGSVVAFDSSASPIDTARRNAILGRLDDAMWLARAIHLCRRPLHERPPPGTLASRRLSERERSCLALSASGLTSRDIAGKLGIASRTVDFHIGNVLAKLSALNRHEAIAKAIAQGWLPS